MLNAFQQKAYMDLKDKDGEISKDVKKQDKKKKIKSWKKNEMARGQMQKLISYL